MSGQAGFEPRVIGFLCNWCSYAGADKAGVSQKAYPANFRAVRVMCGGRVEPEFVLGAFREGADGVLILTCHPGDCHYEKGNVKAAARYRMLLRLMEQLNMDSRRLRMQFVSAGEGERFVTYVTAMVEAVRELGPIIPEDG